MTVVFPDGVEPTPWVGPQEIELDLGKIHLKSDEVSDFTIHIKTVMEKGRVVDVLTRVSVGDTTALRFDEVEHPITWVKQSRDYLPHTN